MNIDIGLLVLIVIVNVLIYQLTSNVNKAQMDIVMLRARLGRAEQSIRKSK